MKPVQECRSALKSPLIKSNRLQHGMKRRRWDPNPHEGLQICMKYEESVAAGSSRVEALSALVKSWSRRRSSLKSIVGQGRAYWEEKKRDKMKVGATSRNRNGERLKSHERVDGENKGCRDAGGGAKLQFPGHMKALERVITSELENGYAMEPEECVLHWEWLLQRDAVALESKKDRSNEEHVRLQQLQDKLKKLGGIEYRKCQKRQIMRLCRYTYMKPQRQVKISLQEEARRARRTWMEWDFMLHTAVQQDAGLLKDLVIDPDAFASHVGSGSMVCGWSDQVPWWGFMQTPRQLYQVQEGFVGPVRVWGLINLSP